MNKLTAFLILTTWVSMAHAQQDMFIFKKKNRTLAIFKKDSYIAFQLKSGQWYTGDIMKVQNDSFTIHPMVVRYGLMGADTAHYGYFSFAISDIYAMPKQGIQIDYIDGRYQITRSGGHVHFYWIKGGWLFRAVGAGYIFLDGVNGLLRNDFTLSDKKLWYAAALFLFGELLHFTYRPSLRIGKKYHFQIIRI